MIYILLEILAVSALLLVGYRVLLERKVRFGWCRLYLLLLPINSVAIPMLNIPLWRAKVVEISATVASVANIEGQVVADTVGRLSLQEVIIFIVGSIYAVTLLVMVGLMLYQWAKISSLRRGARVVCQDDVEIVFTQQPIASFSFFRRIYLWEQCDVADLRVIVLHEQSHIRHNHSLERLLMELMKAILCWNPFIWFSARLLTEVQEFEADSDVLNSGEDRTNYIHTIFKQLFGYSPDIANGLRDSLTKKRFIMMTKERRGRYARLRLVAIVPLILSLVVVFGTTAKPTQYVNAELSTDEGKPKPIYVVNGKVVESIDDIDTNLIDRMNIYKDLNDIIKPLLEAAGYTSEDVSVRGCVEISVVDADKLVPIGTSATYQGVVIDQQNRPIPGAVIRISKDKGVIADADGRFSIEAVSGTIASCEMVGYKTNNSVSLGKNPNVTVVLSDEKAAKSDSEGDSDVPIDDDIPFVKVDQMPTFQGGDLNSFRTWAMMQLRYPSEAREKGIQGDVIAQFVIDTDGSVRAEDIVILKSADKLLSDEVLRVISKSPKWSPGYQKGRAVKVKYIIPLTFALGETKSEAPKGDVDGVVVRSW